MHISRGPYSIEENCHRLWSMGSAGPLLHPFAWQVLQYIHSTKLHFWFPSCVIPWSHYRVFLAQSLILDFFWAPSSCSKLPLEIFTLVYQQQFKHGRPKKSAHPFLPLYLLLPPDLELPSPWAQPFFPSPHPQVQLVSGQYSWHLFTLFLFFCFFLLQCLGRDCCLLAIQQAN